MVEEEYLNDEIAALKLAVDNEKKIRDFYLEKAEKIKSPLAKKAFIFLADEELKHIDAIDTFNRSINEGDVPVIEEGPEDEATLKTKEFFSSSIASKAEEVILSDTDLKVYELGLEMEQKGYDFYKKASEKAENENIKALFEFLMKEENAHYHLINNIIEYMKDPVGWHQDQEQWFFEG